MASDLIVFPSVLLLAVGAGFVIARWRALGLVVLVPLASPFYEPDLDGAPRWFWPTVMLGPPVLAALALGVAGRRLLSRQRHRHR